MQNNIGGRMGGDERNEGRRKKIDAMYEAIDAEIAAFEDAFARAEACPERQLALVEKELEGAFGRDLTAARAKVMALLGWECLGKHEEALLAAMEKVAQKRVVFLAEFLRFEKPELGGDCAVRLISLLGSYGQLNLIPEVSWREVMRPEPEGSPGYERCGRIRRQAEASIMEAVDILSGGKATPDGRRIKDCAEINAFLAYSLKKGDDGLVMGIIAILERNKFYGPIGMVALSADSGHIVKTVAMEVLRTNGIPLELVPAGVKALESRREVTFPGGDAVDLERMSWKPKPAHDGCPGAGRGIKKQVN